MTTAVSRLGARIIEYLSFWRHAGQVPELDGLRGIAVILVLLRHAVQPFLDDEERLNPILGLDFATFMANGWIGVDLYLVLSGFLIAHHVLCARDRPGGHWQWQAYPKKRALRIIPA